jgi:HlyD family secretion protein
MTLPEYREGDLVYPGNAIAEVIQLDKMQIQAKIDESDRTNVQPGQPVEFTLDALPGQPLRGKVASVAGQTSRASFGPSAGTRRFDVTILLERGNPALRPGMTGVALISGTEVKNVLLLPRQAVFEREGKPVVYLRRGGSFEPQPVVVKNRTYNQVVVQGLDPASEVALINPDERRAQRSGPPSSAPAQAPGRP